MAVNSYLAARAGAGDYTIPDRPRTVMPGTYSNIIVNAAAGTRDPDIRIGTGTVILTGSNGELYNVLPAYITPQSPTKLLVSPTGTGAATLQLLSGNGEGNARLTPTARYAANLYIGQPGPSLGDVYLTGKIDGISRAFAQNGRQALIETRGANLHLTGGIGSGSNNMISSLNAWNGNVFVARDTAIQNDPDYVVTTYTASARNGYHIDITNHGILAWRVDLKDNSYIQAYGELNVGFNIGGTETGNNGGSMVLGTKLESLDDHVFLWRGISEAAGQIFSGRSIVAHQHNVASSTETALENIFQGGADPLYLEATIAGNQEMGDVLIGNGSLDGIKAARDIISGTFTAILQSATPNAHAPLENRPYFNGAAQNIYYPRYALTANYLEAANDIAAGEINMPLQTGKTPYLKAGHLLVLKTPVNGAMAASSGNVLIDNGSFELTSSDNVSYLETVNGAQKTSSLEFSSQVDGNFTINANENANNSFTTLNVGQHAAISNGALKGVLLQANKADFTNITQTSISNALKVATDFTATGNGASSVTLTEVEGAASVNGGSWAGAYFTANKAEFNNLSAINLNGNAAETDSSLPADLNLKAGSIDLAMAEKGSANIGAAKSDGAIKISNGDYIGASLESGGDAVFSNLKSMTVQSANIHGKLGSSNNGASSFNTLSIGESGEISGGSLSASQIITGANTGSVGDLALANLSFNFSGTGENPAQIHGNFTASGNLESNFTKLAVGNKAQITGGKLSGANLSAQSGVFQNLHVLTISNALELKGDLAISGTASANAQTVSAGGNAALDGGQFSGKDFTAKEAKFTNLEKLEISGELAAKSASIALASSGSAQINAIKVDQGLNLSNGAFSIASVNTGSDANIEELSSLRVSDSAVIGGNLTVSANKNSEFQQLEVGGAASVDGGSISAAQIETGAKTGIGGNVTINNASFHFGENSNQASSIHGSLLATGNSWSTFENLTVDDVLEISGGYLVGSELHVGSGVFRNNVVAHIDKLVLDSADNSLRIEDNSMVIVKSVSDPAGNSLISSGGLVILGDIDDPESWSEFGDFDLENGILRGEKALVRVGEITGKGLRTSADDIQAYTLAAKSVNIEDANLRLGGIGAYASKVEGDLIIRQNGETWLGDIGVGGEIQVDGGSLQGRKVESAKNAAFDNVELTFLGTGENASSIGGDLSISNNRKAALGDIAVKGGMNVAEGALEAGRLEIAQDAVMNGVELTLKGTVSRPGQIEGNLSLNENRSASLGSLSVGKDLSAENGSLAADTLKVGQDLTLTGVQLELKGTTENPGDVRGAVELKRNESAALGNIAIGGNLSVDGGNLSAETLKIEKDAYLTGVETTLKGSLANPGEISGNLTLENNTGANLGALDIGKDFLASKGNVTADAIRVGGNASLSDLELNLSGHDAYADEVKGNLILNSVKVSAGQLTVGGSLNSSNGTFASTQLSVGKDANFSAIELSLAGTENLPDVIGNNLALSNDSHATFDTLRVGGKTSADGGTFDAHKLTTGSASFTDADIDIHKVISSAAFAVSGGKFNSSELGAENVVLKNGANARLNTLRLEGTDKFLQLADPADTKGGTSATIENLDLAGATLFTGNIQIEPATLAIRAFTQGQSGNINGNIAVGPNSRVTLGSLNAEWFALGKTDGRALLSLAQPMRMGSGYGLHISGAGAAQPQAGKLRFDAASLLVVDGSDARSYYTGEFIKSANLSAGNGAQGALSAEAKASAQVNGGAQIYIRNPVPNTVLVALGENIATTYVDGQKSGKSRAETGEAWKGANLRYDNADKVRIDRLDGDYAGQFSVVPISDDTPNRPDNPQDPDQPDNPDQPGNPEQPGASDKPGNPDNPENPGNNNQPSQPGRPPSPSQIDQPEISGPAKIVTIGGVPQLLIDSSHAVEAAMAARTGLRALIWRPDDINARSISLWAVPLYRTSAGWNLDADSHEFGFHGGIGGIAIGGDLTVEKVLRAGLAFNIGGCYAKSSGDFPQTSNNMDFWGFGAYALWHFGNFGLSVDGNFNSSYNKLKQDGHYEGLWPELKADAQAWILGLGMKLEYRLETGFMDIFPHAGVKYHYINVYDYDIKARGQTLISGESFNQNIWTFPIGLELAREFAFDNGWNIKPALDFRVSPAAGDVKARTTSRFNGSDAEMTFNTQIMDYVTFGASAGLEATKGNFSLGVNYSLEAGAKSASNAIFGTLRYEF